MNLLEYEAKNILKEYNIPIPRGTTVGRDDSPPDAPIVLKSQVHTGGRGKVGGVRVITEGDTGIAAKELFALPIKGELPHTILAEEVLEIANEYYLSLLLNRSNATIELVAHKQGGIEIETHDSKEFSRYETTPTLVSTLGDTLADYFDIPEKSFVLQELLDKLYRCFTSSDALLLEINPLVLTRDGRIVAGDCKMTLDSAAAFRHPEWKFEQMPTNANFVTLDTKGTVATIANGAGLAMATVDAVKAAGFTPANFLDIGGGATVEGIVNSFEKILAFNHINAIIINIFGGIVRCDDVAAAILEARKQFQNLPRLYIRLSGTRSQEATALLATEGIPLYPDLPACLKEIAHE